MTRVASYSLALAALAIAGVPAHAETAHAKAAHKPAPKDDDAETESEHVVKPGETLGGIAIRAKVPRVLIVEANHLKAPYVVKTGQKLTLPRTRHHKVKPGETGFDIAIKYGVPFSSIAVANGLKKDAVLKSGQDLLIPTVLKPSAKTEERQADSEDKTDKSDSDEKPAKPATRLVDKDGKAARDEAHPAKKPARVAAKPDDDDKASSSDDAPELAMPVNGKVRRGYTARDNGDPHDGIDIVAPAGTAVRAAATGKVIFAGKEPQSFGNLVVVDHGHGWQTAYGFLSKITVERGDTVKAHERLGLVGHSGKATHDELHFELRHKNMPVDPTDEMPELAKGKSEPSGVKLASRKKRG